MVCAGTLGQKGQKSDWLCAGWQDGQDCLLSVAKQVQIPTANMITGMSRRAV